MTPELLPSLHECGKSGSNDEDEVWFDVLDEPESYEDCSGTSHMDCTVVDAHRAVLSTFLSFLQALPMMQHQLGDRTILSLFEQILEKRRKPFWRPSTAAQLQKCRVQDPSKGPEALQGMHPVSIAAA